MANARAVATQYQAAYCTTDYEEILEDDQVELVMITTRHDLHGQMALQALHAGKHVFVEKPLTLKENELAEIERFCAKNLDGPLLMVGFNRRFVPAMQAIRQILEQRTTPIIANYCMNAGFIPPDHWGHGAEGGGRNLGEACHIYDLFNSLCSGAKAIAVNAYSIDPLSQQWHKNDNFVAIIKYAEGSVCTLTYTALGATSYPKETMEVFADGKVIVMHDYKTVQVHGGKHCVAHCVEAVRQASTLPVTVKHRPAAPHWCLHQKLCAASGRGGAADGGALRHRRSDSPGQ